MLTSDFIQDTRDEIFQGWAQRSYRQDNGNVCILGAMDRVALRNIQNGGIPAHALAKNTICQVAAELFPDDFSGSIPSFNDRHNTSKDDVLALLDKASLKLAEVGQ